jgi:hypothetical protein
MAMPSQAADQKITPESLPITTTISIGLHLQHMGRRLHMGMELHLQDMGHHLQAIRRSHHQDMALRRRRMAMDRLLGTLRQGTHRLGMGTRHRLALAMAILVMVLRRRPAMGPFLRMAIHRPCPTIERLGLCDMWV